MNRKLDEPREEHSSGVGEQDLRMLGSPGVQRHDDTSSIHEMKSVDIEKDTSLRKPLRKRFVSVETKEEETSVPMTDESH